ncbi:fas apoptotic inhibitory molecule 1-like [Dysidea avara]|uniref:fas apoptotic inhibitory molecule 1-like n=1 Tax=Dysidea avara TaxID=196820 RepID=UPI0033323C8E
MSSPNPGDIVHLWKITLPDGVHTITFEHGTTSGKRAVNVDGVELMRKNWMFSLVGVEKFKISGRSAQISIVSNGWTFEYTLEIEGKSLKRFAEAEKKNTRTWLPNINRQPHRVVLEITNMDVYLDGEKVETRGEFVSEGVETHFDIDNVDCYIRSVSSGNKHKGLNYTLVVDDSDELPPTDNDFVESFPI